MELTWIEESRQKPPLDEDANDGCSVLVLIAHAARSWGSGWYDFERKSWRGLDDDSPVTHWALVRLPSAQ